MVTPITARVGENAEVECCTKCSTTCNSSCWPWNRKKTPKPSPATQTREIERVIEVIERRKASLSVIDNRTYEV